MTSKATISAHCTENKQVRVIVSDSKTQEIYSQKVLQNGESFEVVFFDDRVVSSSEELKEQQEGA